MNELETLILTQVANEMPVTSADEAFRSYRPKEVRQAMLALGKLGWFEATLPRILLWRSHRALHLPRINSRIESVFRIDQREETGNGRSGIPEGFRER